MQYNCREQTVNSTIRRTQNRPSGRPWLGWSRRRRKREHGIRHDLAPVCGYTVLISPLVVTWYLLMELGSILENVGKMGAPLPEFLKKMIAVLKATVDTAGEENRKE